MVTGLIGLVMVFLLLFGLNVIRKRLKKAKGIGILNAKPFEQPDPSCIGWDQVLAHPGKIRLETLHAGNVTGTVHGIINLKDKKELQIKDEKLRAPLLAHLVIHEKLGAYLIDTGFDKAFSETPWGRFEGWLKRFGSFSVPKGKAIEEQLAARGVSLRGVFCTHFHEHQGGAPSLPDDIPFVFGQGEKEMSFYPFMYSRFLRRKTDLRAIDFRQAVDMPMAGKAVDLFGDGSLWAIDTPGHTPGHVSFLVNGMEGPSLIMGDICMCRKGYELGVESGGQFAGDLAENRRSFRKIAELLKTYPSIKPIFGHETEEFQVEYLG